MNLATTIIFLCVVACALGQTTYGFNSSSLAACKSGCSITDPTIWVPEGVPGELDTIDVNVGGTFVINVDSNVTLANLQIGTTNTGSNPDSHTFNILTGYTLNVTGTTGFLRSSTVNVAQGGTFISGGQSSTSGKWVNSGLCVYNGIINPSFHVGTDSEQTDPLNIVYGTYILQEANMHILTTFTVSSQSSFSGIGNITCPHSSIDGTITPGISDSDLGTLYFSGDLILSSTSTVVFSVAGQRSFDHIVLGGALTADGSLYFSLVQDYNPLIHTKYVIMNHSAFNDGFKTVRGEGLSNLFNNDWTIQPDQAYTTALYGASSTVMCSFVVVIACLLLSAL